MTILANAAGASAYDRQKAFFRLSDAVPATASPAPLLQVTGYGADRYPPGAGTDRTNAQSQTEQTDVGPLVSSNSSSTIACVAYTLDTEGGNSGSLLACERNGDRHPHKWQ